MASLRQLADPQSGEVLDQALVLWMPGPASFTGEDVIELHLHGGRAVIGATMSALSRLGLRGADPGEFTRRAFEHGRLDLSEAEAVADLVDAETEAQRRQALDQLGGALTQRAAGWRGALIEALAGLEAAIDFPDEDLPETVLARATPLLHALASDLALAASDRRGERVREGFHVALIGAPNAGKSSLLNVLAGRDVAIVTDVAGTTRDVIEVSLNLAGYRVILSDTAGVRETTDIVEQEGVRRARQRAQDADLRLWIVDRNGAAGAWNEAASLVRPGDILVLMKADLPSHADAESALRHAHHIGAQHLDLSIRLCTSDALLGAITGKVVDFMTGSEAPTLSRERHRAALQSARGHIERALVSVDPELAAEDVRLAARALERISGRIDSEAVLDKVFASFCIGK
jgi:tRNA modification GTPase